MNHDAKKILLNKDEMYRLYIEENISIRNIAKLLNVSVWTVKDYLNRKYGIYKTQITPDPKQHITKQYLSNKDWLKNEYLIIRKPASQIAAELGVSDGRVDKWIKTHGFYGLKTYKHTCKDSLFDYKDPIFCYYAGYVATDGHVDSGTTPRVSIRSNDECSKTLFKALARYFEFTGEVRLYNKSYDLTMTSKTLIDELFNHFNITPAKTKTLKFPDSFFNDTCASMFLRGVIDGDGNIRKDGGVRLYCGSNDFIDGCIAFLNKRFTWNINKTFIRKIYPGFSLSGRKANQLLDWIYSNDTTYFLDRKYERYLSTRKKGIKKDYL